MSLSQFVEDIAGTTIACKIVDFAFWLETAPRCKSTEELVIIFCSNLVTCPMLLPHVLPNASRVLLTSRVARAKRSSDRNSANPNLQSLSMHLWNIEPASMLLDSNACKPSAKTRWSDLNERKITEAWPLESHRTT